MHHFFLLVPFFLKFAFGHKVKSAVSQGIHQYIFIITLHVPYAVQGTGNTLATTTKTPALWNIHLSKTVCLRV